MFEFSDSLPKISPNASKKTFRLEWLKQTNKSHIPYYVSKYRRIQESLNVRKTRERDQNQSTI